MKIPENRNGPGTRVWRQLPGAPRRGTSWGCSCSAGGRGVAVPVCAALWAGQPELGLYGFLPASFSPKTFDTCAGFLFCCQKFWKQGLGVGKDMHFRSWGEQASPTCRRRAQCLARCLPRACLPCKKKAIQRPQVASTGTKLFPALRKARPTLDQVLNFFRGVGFVHLYRQWGPLDPRDRRTGGTGQEGLVGTHRGVAGTGASAKCQ